MRVMFRRSRLTIYFEVLEAIERGSEKKTWIMYGANLSWNLLNEILEHLIKSGFVRVQGKSERLYRLAGKGIRALSYHRKSLEGFHPAIELHETIKIP